MGCGTFSRSKSIYSLPISIKPRISRDIFKGQSISTASDSAYLSRLNTTKIVDPHEKTCLKFTIFDKFHEIAISQSTTKNINNEYTNDLNYFKKNWTLFQSAFSYFELTFHGTCIENFTVVDGIVVLLISNIACKNLFGGEILVLHFPPYLQILSTNNCNSETVNLIKCWQNFSTTLFRFNKKKIMNLEKIREKFEKLMKKYAAYAPSTEELKEFKKSKKKLSWIIERLIGLVKQIEECKNKINDFVNEIKLRKKEIEELGEIAFINGCYSADQIVHFILAR